MRTSSPLRYLLPALFSLLSPLAVQAQAPTPMASFSFGSGWQAKGRPPLGLAIAASPGMDRCGVSALICDRNAPASRLYLVGNAPVWQSFSVHGKLGTAYGRSDTAVLGAAPFGTGQGYGLSFGAGVSYALTPRLSALLEWESTDARLAGGGREPVRSTSMGLQYRY